MGVGAEGNLHAVLTGEFENRAAGINLLALLPQPGGVELDGATGFGGGREKLIVERRAVTCRTMAKFFRQIHVADDFKQL